MNISSRGKYVGCLAVKKKEKKVSCRIVVQIDDFTVVA